MDRAQALTVFLSFKKRTRTIRLRGKIPDSTDATLTAAAASAAAHPCHY
jgi:hypothetical protein